MLVQQQGGALALLSMGIETWSSGVSQLLVDDLELRIFVGELSVKDMCTRLYRKDPRPGPRRLCPSPDNPKDFVEGSSYSPCSPYPSSLAVG